MTALFGPINAIEQARAFRDAGANGVFTFEGTNDVFAPLTLASTVGGLDLMTNVAIAFPRNPIHLAHQAIDHQVLSEGRFALGLGTQIRTQIEKRFGAQFDKPVARMTELIAALRAIFESWTTGERLDFRGEYYRHTLMTPNFSPGRIRTGRRRSMSVRWDLGSPAPPPSTPTACSSCRSATSGSCTR